jgi:hypothetical protein
MKTFPANDVWRRAGLIALLFSITGCSHLTTETGSPLPDTRPHLHVDRSTMRDAIKVLGPPMQISATPPGGAVMLYEHNVVVENQLGFSVNYWYLKYLKFVFARACLSHEARLLVFDRDGILRAIGDEDWRKPFGSGSAVQLIVTEKELVDTSIVSRPARQHDWGKQWLARLPVLLNSAQDLHAGTNGLEQTLSPAVVGQHALEMSPPIRKPKRR